jgi:hypothetical protein
MLLCEAHAAVPGVCCCVVLTSAGMCVCGTIYGVGSTTSRHSCAVLRQPLTVSDGHRLHALSPSMWVGVGVWGGGGVAGAHQVPTVSPSSPTHPVQNGVALPPLPAWCWGCTCLYPLSQWCFKLSQGWLGHKRRPCACLCRVGGCLGQPQPQRMAAGCSSSSSSSSGGRCPLRPQQPYMVMQRVRCLRLCSGPPAPSRGRYGQGDMAGPLMCPACHQKAERLLIGCHLVQALAGNVESQDCVTSHCGGGGGDGGAAARGLRALAWYCQYVSHHKRQVT